MSVRIEFVLAELTQPEALALTAMLKSYDQHAIADQVKSGGFEHLTKEAQEKLGHVDAAIKPSAQAPGEVPAAVAPITATEIVEQQKRRGRPKKEEVAAVQPDPPAANGAESQPEAAAPSADAAGVEPPPTPATGETPTLDDLRNALLKFTDKNGVPAGLQMLKADFNCARVSDVFALPVAQQQAFIQKCNG